MPASAAICVATGRTEAPKRDRRRQSQTVQTPTKPKTAPEAPTIGTGSLDISLEGEPPPPR